MHHPSKCARPCTAAHRGQPGGLAAVGCRGSGQAPCKPVPGQSSGGSERTRGTRQRPIWPTTRATRRRPHQSTPSTRRRGMRRRTRGARIECDSARCRVRGDERDMTPRGHCQRAAPLRARQSKAKSRGHAATSPAASRATPIPTRIWCVHAVCVCDRVCVCDLVCVCSVRDSHSDSDLVSMCVCLRVCACLCVRTCVRTYVIQTSRHVLAIKQDDIAARHASNYLLHSASPPPPAPKPAKESRHKTPQRLGADASLSIGGGSVLLRNSPPLAVFPEVCIARKTKRMSRSQANLGNEKSSHHL